MTSPPVVSRLGVEPRAPGLKVRVPTTAPAPPVPSQTLTRLPGLYALYGKAYRWDGSCHKCGSFDFDDDPWDGGWKATCSGCGFWTCWHTVAASGFLCHTSAGTGLWRGAPPTGCPTLTEGVVLQTPCAQAASAGADGPLAPGPRPERQFSEKQNAAFQALLDRRRQRKVAKDSGGGGALSQVSPPAKTPIAPAAAPDVAGSPCPRGEEADAPRCCAPAGRPDEHQEGAGSLPGLEPVPSAAEVTA